MEKTPMEWIHKLFLCMKEFYGERWSFKDVKAEIYAKSMWQSALTGLSHDEIKNALVFCKWQAKYHPTFKPPHQMEFFKYAKEKHNYFSVPKKEEFQANPEIARSHLAKIRQSLNPRFHMEHDG